MAKLTKKHLALMANIKLAMDGGTVFYLSKDEADPLLNADPAVIEVNTGMLDPTGKAAARLTPAGEAILSKPDAEVAEKSPYEVISGAVLPESKRGAKGGGAPIIYPFHKLEIGQVFFVPVSDKHPNPVKTLGSTVSSANMRYAEKTGETKQVERTMKDKTTKKAVTNGNGEKVKETVTVPVYKYSRKFTLRSVKAGETYGNWTAPGDGALIGRVEVN